ncbi:MAG: hypothetical protein CFH01_01045 [Alphaproteobacteria bacterium MarineAlpha2_Bin1]|nr:MAG: hypothetical protein CFH01_01045 [Alphaproteobacteria bacterium MarineAlpha2_Bin1]
MLSLEIYVYYIIFINGKKMKWFPLILAILVLIFVVLSSRIVTIPSFEDSSDLPSDTKINEAVNIIAPKK